MSYFSKSYTTGANWVEVVLPDPHRFKSITIVNDDGTNQVNIKLNDLGNDEIAVKAGEVISLIIPVTSFFYQAEAGTPAIRVMCDGTD
jgi:hypothetical protein